LIFRLSIIYPADLQSFRITSPNCVKQRWSCVLQWIPSLFSKCVSWHGHR